MEEELVTCDNEECKKPCLRKNGGYLFTKKELEEFQSKYCNFEEE